MSLADFEKIRDILTTDFDDFWEVKTFEDELKSENSYYLVAEFNSEIVGYAGMKIVLDEADIMNIVTKKDARNFGIASAIFEQLINVAHSKGLHKLTLEVDENNFPAIHLYEKFGFKRIAIRKNYYSNSHTAIIMQLTLNSAN